MPSLPKNLQFKLQIQMTSDWHVGSGSGRGEIDSAVQRDHDNLPYIPAKTLTGILRDGCEQVAIALDGDTKGFWHDWINFIFGDQPALAEEAIEGAPRPAVISIRSAYLENGLQDALNQKKELQGAIAFIKPGVAIDPATGSAKPDFLRFEEVVRTGAILTTDCHLDFSEYPTVDQTTKETVYALLIAGAKLVERLGGKRRRGNGTCDITVDANANNWITWLQNQYSQATSPPAWQQSQLSPFTNSQPSQSNSNNKQTWWRIPLTLQTLSPLVIPKRTVGNVVESLDYIPGRYLIRHLHRTIGQYIDLNEAIATNQIIITNATIDINGQAGKPTPLCLFSEKLDGGLKAGKKVYNRFTQTEPKNDQGKEIQLKGERSGYVGKFDGENLPEHKTVELEINTHNTIRDDVQRPTSDVGGVYSYQAIKKGTTFHAELRIPCHIKDYLDKKDPNWHNKFDGKIRIGQSKKDQYGSVDVKSNQPTKFLSNKTVNEKLYVWFLSDVLLRNQNLNSTTNPEDFKDVLAKELGVTLTEPPDNQLLSLMMRSQRTESWQVRWGLPRPTMLGWQAGSCVVYEITEGIPDSAKLAELEAKGIGDRRVEGYGQISFNDPLLTSKLKDKTRSTVDSDQPNIGFNPISQNHPSFQYARIIETAAWRKAIENKALAIAANESERQEILGIKIIGEESHPSMSQLGSLRATVRRLKKPQDRNKVISWLTALESVSNREKKWDKTDQGLTKIKDLVLEKNSNLIWDYFKNIDWEKITITQGGEQALKDELWAEAVRTLVDAIIRGHKRDLEKAQDKTKNNINGEAA
ncbi:RAMP superfamily CRISPR-associated protein [Picosynechococcus sp. NKBG15041c]|uniref:RAMP superfamily CRISPR-associated protein n=1 Tax=Picosynechococcus sp. NKBG15041c TaxID=1407650 RepID=UPI000425F419|nr:RAMP superfamily CRISPR-associated protein [Picosynechococcus sp. NKBG15041c]